MSETEGSDSIFFLQFVPVGSFLRRWSPPECCALGSSFPAVAILGQQTRAQTRLYLPRLRPKKEKRKKKKRLLRTSVHISPDPTFFLDLAKIPMVTSAK
jgi:hypothetical protein